jgi:FkbM family methyltransferase
VEARVDIGRRLLSTAQHRVDPRWLAPVASVVFSVRRREPVLIRYADGAWVHRYRGGTVVRGTLSGPSASQQDRDTRDIVLYGYRLRPGDTVLELGAGVGEQTRLLSTLVGPSGRVVCVEAHPRTYRCLCRTIELNGLSNVTPVHAAVTAVRGTAFIQDRVNYSANALTAPGDTGMAVPGQPLDELIDGLGVDRIDLLMMNIEGLEYSVLAAARHVLHRVRNFVVSCHDFKADREGGDWQRTYAQVRSLLEAEGCTILARRTDSRPWIPCYIYASRPSSDSTPDHHVRLTDHRD